MGGFTHVVVDVDNDAIRVLETGNKHWIHLAYVSRHSAGGRFAKFADRGPGAVPVALHITQGNTLMAYFNSDGSVDLIRLGAGVFTVAVSMAWV